MCGLIAVCDRGPAAPVLLEGLQALQHRGADAAGIVTFDRTFHLHKGTGLVAQVFGEGEAGRWPGGCGLGHVRYATQGANDAALAQPFAVHYPLGVAMAHNGNVINPDEVRERLLAHGRMVETSSDLELLLYTFLADLEECSPAKLSADRVFRAVEAVQERVRGAYAAIAIVARVGLLAFQDPNGLRPLILGRRESGFALASETTALIRQGYTPVEALGAGEALLVRPDGQVLRHQGRRALPAFCSFESIYFSREDSVFGGRTVASRRRELGRLLAPAVAELGPDILVDVPSSGWYFAAGLSEASGVPHQRAILRNAERARSFIQPSAARRAAVVGRKFSVLSDLIAGASVALVDDSIVRGTTTQHLVRQVREAGAAAVFVLSASPPIRHPCVYGIDMSVPSELIAIGRDEAEIAHAIGADAIRFLPLEALTSHFQVGHCTACFSGHYPTPVSPREFAALHADRIDPIKR